MSPNRPQAPSEGTRLEPDEDIRQALQARRYATGKLLLEKK
jgi:hypothetical protein